MPSMLFNPSLFMNKTRKVKDCCYTGAIFIAASSTRISKIYFSAVRHDSGTPRISASMFLCAFMVSVNVNDCDESSNLFNWFQHSAFTSSSTDFF